MKRVFCLFAVAALIGIPLAHEAFAKPKAKIAICHVAGDGNHHVIVVSQNAQKAHLKHGDCLISATATPAPRAGTACCPTRLVILDDPLTPEDESAVTTECADYANTTACTFGTTP